MAPKKKVIAPGDSESGKLLFAEKSSWMSANIKANAVNSKIINDMLIPAVNYLKNLESFSDWEAPVPLQLKTQDDKAAGELGGFMAPFDKKCCMQSLTNSGKYICAMALPHFNLHYSATPGVRLSKAQIDEAVMDDDFTYKVWPMQKVAVCSDEDKFTDLTPISPEEIRIAKILGFVRRHELGEVTPEQLTEFKRTSWCIPTTFVRLNNEDARFFAALAERSDSVKNCRMVRRNGSQQVEEIISTANRLGGNKCTAQKIYDAYKRHQTGDGGANGEYVSTMVSLDTINMALVVQRAIKDVPELAVILQEADDMLMTSSPFFYISNLATLAKKIKNPADLQWAMTMMLDGILQQPDLIWTCRALIGILDQFQFKHQLNMSSSAKSWKTWT